MIRKPITLWLRVLLGFLSVALLLVGYTWLSHRQHVKNPDDTTIPSWSQLGHGVVQMIEPHKRTGKRMIVEDTKASGARYFLGLSIGVIGAALLGLAMGCFAPVEAFCQPVLALFAQIPATAALAVFFVMVGTGRDMYVAMIVFGILPVLAQTVFLAVKEFPEELQFKAYTLGASHAEVILSILLRYVLPKLLDTLRLVIGPALVYLIAAESLLGDVGFGYRIRLLSKLQNMSIVYPYLALLAAFGFGTDFLIRWLQGVLCPWYGGGKR
jgi:NitT/TauT family transport system permease protein